MRKIVGKPRRIKRFIPLPLRRLGRYCVQHRKEFWRWGGILLGGTPAKGQLRVYYGHDHIPSSSELAHGGMVKFQRMQDAFPNSPRRFNVLYMVSSWRPKDWSQLLWLARRKGARIVWNQNGVAYPAWRKVGWEKINAPMAELLHAADYVFYQSQFCKLSADRFLGERNEGYEILYNAVDTDVFTPNQSDPDPHHLVLLLAGSHNQCYRIETALQTLVSLTRQRSDVRLLITGRMMRNSDNASIYRMVSKLVTDLGIREHVVFSESYSQEQAPSMFQKAHLLLHTQYNDACPGLVLEAMACGLPVVYSQSGGVPELVGKEAGIGVPAELSWEKISPPDPKMLAEAVLQIAERRKEFAEAARQRAVEQFDLHPWLNRHREIFEQLLKK